MTAEAGTATARRRTVSISARRNCRRAAIGSDGSVMRIMPSREPWSTSGAISLILPSTGSAQPATLISDGMPSASRGSAVSATSAASSNSSSMASRNSGPPDDETMPPSVALRASTRPSAGAFTSVLSTWILMLFFCASITRDLRLRCRQSALGRFQLGLGAVVGVDRIVELGLGGKALRLQRLGALQRLAAWRTATSASAICDAVCAILASAWARLASFWASCVSSVERSSTASISPFFTGRPGRH